MAMSSERWQSDNSMCERIIELQSRRQVIERWLATVGTHEHSNAMQEMLAAVEAELTALREQHSATKYLATNNRLELDDRTEGANRSKWVASKEKPL
jgi:hypothetical protein